MCQAANSLHSLCNNVPTLAPASAFQILRRPLVLVLPFLRDSCHRHSSAPPPPAASAPAKKLHFPTPRNSVANSAPAGPAPALVLARAASAPATGPQPHYRLCPPKPRLTLSNSGSGVRGLQRVSCVNIHAGAGKGAGIRGATPLCSGESATDRATPRAPTPLPERTPPSGKCKPLSRGDGRIALNTLWPGGGVWSRDPQQPVPNLRWKSSARTCFAALSKYITVSSRMRIC